MGQPAKPRSINIEGLKRRDFSEKQIRNIKNAYKYLYKSDLRIEEAIEKISSLTEVSDEVTVMIDFLNQSSRGIVR
jgi:UDP-N-acetylglucosamine acyltransferase